MATSHTHKLLRGAFTILQTKGIKHVREIIVKRKSSLASVSNFPLPMNTIPWSPEKINRIELIGNVGAQPEIRKLESLATVAMFSVAVKRPTAPNQRENPKVDWIDCEAWEDLAYSIERYVQKGTQVHVVGTFIKSEWEDKQTKEPRSKYKVRVKKIDLVAPSRIDAQEQSISSHIDENFYQTGSSLSPSNDTEELWKIFFENPNDWWDNREKKFSERSPDFKHKQSGDALWMISRRNPDWVVEKLVEGGYLLNG